MDERVRHEWRGRGKHGAEARGVQHPTQWGVGAGAGAALEEEVESEGVSEHALAAHATVEKDWLVSGAGTEAGA